MLQQNKEMTDVEIFTKTNISGENKMNSRVRVVRPCVIAMSGPQLSFKIV